MVCLDGFTAGFAGAHSCGCNQMTAGDPGWFQMGSLICLAVGAKASLHSSTWPLVFEAHWPLLVYHKWFERFWRQSWWYFGENEIWELGRGKIKNDSGWRVNSSAWLEAMNTTGQQDNRATGRFVGWWPGNWIWVFLDVEIDAYGICSARTWK